MSAVISACGLYRYRLTRVWATGEGAVLWVMLNPSTADATVDDATIRRCRAYSLNWGFGGLMVGNLFAYRSTDPGEMFLARTAGRDIIGPENLDHLGEMARLATKVICAWGSRAEQAGSQVVQSTLRVLKSVHPELHCLRLTAGGYPHHPLRLPGCLEPQRYHPTILTE